VRSMKYLISTTGLLIAAALFLALNTFSESAFKSARADLTENKLFTLSDGTRNVLGKLEEPITLRFYFSKKLAAQAPNVQGYAQRVQELLEEYVAHSHGKVKLEVSDPEPFSEDEDRAVGYGLKGAQATASGELLYFGLAATNTTDQEETIPFFQESKEESLEYDITKIIYNLGNPKKKVVGLMTKLPMEGNPLERMRNPNAQEQSWFIMEPIQQMFEVRTVPPTSVKIDSDIAVLMIVHPQGLSPQTLYAIDQYVLGGGKVLAFIDPHCEGQDVRPDPQNPMAAMMANRSSDLGPLLAAWGLQMSPDELVGDKDLALRVNYQNQAVEYLVYLGLRREKDEQKSGGFSKQDFVTSQLDSMNMATVGILTKKDGATTTVTPMLESTPDSMKIQKSMVQFGPDPKRMLESFVAGKEKLMIAARVNGPAKTAYPEGKPKPPDTKEATPPPADDGTQLKESKEPINVIVVADCDMLEDQFWTRTQNFLGQKIAIPTAGNSDFVVNALDNLTGSNDLISLRSRGRFNRPFDRVVEIRKQADTSFRQKEKELEDKLADTEKKLSDMQSSKDSKNSLILTPEQQKAIEGFKDEKIKTRTQLRKVKHEMQKDIESLGTTLKFVNIGLMPALVILAAIGAAALRSSRKGQ
jgi:ABC-type uncharacterized transport system involved in gliding motility auxiliary subunit